ncbi:hypothetical protein GIB67_003462 [Kingdonia uniflora]|uniref:Disease resistance R13L4/SHOC-2-like LRR domain-containing protein n=1 Tax=Kingdonia uniflora TaxID=39325 RepID=A0A7J7PA00_9MAGN|nr:hypothetical protein GIB67_003462 [Kingdonia uniflora]
MSDDSHHILSKPNFMHKVTYLRILDLSFTSIKKLPKEIEKMLLLRYLDLSGTKLEELSEIVSNLCNLQTLKINRCLYLRRLPERMGKLVNLRHLEIEETDGLECLPLGIGRLKSLQTLCKFIVSKGCKLRELKYLNNLHGSLDITNIKGKGNEYDEAELKNKDYFKVLKLNFCAGNNEEDEVKLLDQNVHELLEPHLNLENFLLRGYNGPNPVENITPSPLGKLKSLRHLKIHKLDSVKPINLKVLRILDDGQEGGTTETPELISFPKLKELEVSFMSWENWVMKTKEYHTVMPCLQRLVIDECHNLKTLAHHILPDTLRELYIGAIPNQTWTISCLPPLLEKMTLGEDAGELSRSLTVKKHTNLKSLFILRFQHSTLPEGLAQLTALQI